MVLAGHTDTVPFDDAHWSQSPFALTERDGRLYGLGTCDMKGFFPIAIEAARQFAGATLTAPLTIVATSDEESSMAGARAVSPLPIFRSRVRDDRRTDRLPADLRPQRLHDAVDRAAGIVRSLVRSRPRPQRARRDALRDG